MLERKNSPQKTGEAVHRDVQPLQLTFSSSASKLLPVRAKIHPKRAEREVLLTWSRRGLRKEDSHKDDGEVHCGGVHYGQRWAARAEAGPEQTPPVSGVRCWLRLPFL